MQPGKLAWLGGTPGQKQSITMTIDVRQAQVSPRPNRTLDRRITSDNALITSHELKINNDNSDKMVILTQYNHHHNSTNGPRTEIKDNEQVYDKTQPNGDKYTQISVNATS